MLTQDYELIVVLNINILNFTAMQLINIINYTHKHIIHCFLPNKRTNIILSLVSIRKFTLPERNFSIRRQEH
jgi:hypothetical protein